MGFLFRVYCLGFTPFDGGILICEKAFRDPIKNVFFGSEPSFSLWRGRAPGLLNLIISQRFLSSKSLFLRRISSLASSFGSKGIRG